MSNFNKVKSILVIYWCPTNLGVFQNILSELQSEISKVDSFQLRYLNDTSAYWKKKSLKTTSLYNIGYLIFQIIKINWRIFFYDRVYIFGTNGVIFSIPHLFLNRKKIIAHLNELPKFLDSELFLFSRIERLAVKRIKWLVVSNQDRLHLLKEYMSHDATSFVLENILNYQFYSIDNKNTFLKRHKDDFKFIYAGMISKNRDINLLINFFDGNEKVRLDLIGPVDVAYREEFLKTIQGSRNIIWHGEVTFERVQDFILQADFGVALYTLLNANNRFCAPVKIHEYFFQRLPIIVYNNPPLKSLIHDYKIAFAIHDLNQSARADFNTRLEEFYSQLSNHSFLEYERKSYSDFKTEFARLRLIALS